MHRWLIVLTDMNTAAMMSPDQEMNMEREIKKGQIWRNVHEEMTVVQVNGRLISIQKAPQYCWMDMNEMIFRATHEFVSESVSIELIPKEQEKPVEQVYEVGGTLTLSEAIEAAKRGEIVESVTQGGKVHWHDKCLRWATQNEPVSCSEANLTGWRVVPKSVPMTKELQEALEALLAAKLVSGPLATDTAFGRLALSACDFYQKAKESAK